MTDRTIKPMGRWARKRAHKKKTSLKKDSYRKTGRLRLQAMFKAGVGTKRSKDKAKADTKDKIYSKKTFETYKNQFRYYCDWLERSHPNAHSIDDALEYVDEYLIYLIDEDRSAYTISTAKSALAKVFGVEATQFIATPPRLRANIKRSRESVKRDKHISRETEEALERFTSSTGLRRAEMTRIEATDLFFRGNKAMLRVNKGTKGGRPREVEIVGKTDGETRDIVRRIQGQKGRLFSSLSSHYDNHRYRASYAMKLYERYARDVSKIPKKERYIMRGDRAGEVYDRIAMGVVSKNLGHNRISVIAQSYLYK